MILGTFILDFQTIDFDPDSKIALEFLTKLQRECQLENAFALDEPVPSAGWSFAKLFMSGQFAEKIYSLRSFDIEKSKGKKIEEKLTAWLGESLKNRGCRAQLKMAREMKT